VSNPRGWADANATRKAKRTMPDYFWSRVARGAPTDCWNWLFGKTTRGYGKSYFQGREQHSHRIAWIITNGEIPDGLFVCHKCDNPSCCNPSHLFLGTGKDNMQDCVSKGRRPSGERHPLSKMNADTVRSLRALASEIGLRPAARVLGINRSTAYHACKDTWRSL